MQQLSYHLTQTVSRRVPAKILKWGGSQKWLPLFVPYALVRSLLILATHPVTLIHLSDLVLAPLGLLLRRVGRMPVVANAHGLDVIYPSRFYQAVFPVCASRLDHIICNSEATRLQCVARGIDPERTSVIPVGVDPDDFKIGLPAKERDRWLRRWRLESRPKHMLLTVGRLVRRKGVHYFVSEVLPELVARRDGCIYLVIGDGPERRAVETAVREKKMDGIVRVLGNAPAEELQAAYALADLFVMPNVPVQEDSEGFGIVTVEARAAGLRVVASSLEGITDSFNSEDDGILVPPGDTEALLGAIEKLLEDELTRDERLKRRDRILDRLSWTRIADEYLALFRDVEARSTARNTAQLDL